MYQTYLAVCIVEYVKPMWTLCYIMALHLGGPVTDIALFSSSWKLGRIKRRREENVQCSSHTVKMVL